MSATDNFLQSLQKKSGARVGTMLALDPRTPDETAEAMRVGEGLGLPANVVAADVSGFKRKLDQKKNTTALSGAPKTAKWLEDLNNGILAKDDIDNLSWFEKNVEQSPGALTRGVGRGIVRSGAIVPELGARIDAQLVQDVGRTAEAIYQDELKRLGPNALPEMRATARQTAQARFEAVQGMGAEDRAAILQRGAASLSEAREVLDRAAAIPMNETATKFRDETLANAENTLLGTIKAFASDPVGGMSFIAQTAAEVLPILAASTATTAITRSPAAGVSAMSGGSFLTENANSAMEFLAEKGVDLSTPEAAALVLDDAELMQEAAERGVTRGLIIAMFDAVSGGIAGQALMKSPMGDVVAQGMSQMVLGGTGEAAAQSASGQEISWQDIVTEGLAELATAPVEVGGVAGRGILRNLSKSADAGTTAAAIDEIDRMAANSKLRERAPDKFSEALDAQGESDFYIAADDLREYFQAKDMEFDAETLEAWGIDPIDFRQAESTGGDVTVSRSAYATRISGTEDAAWFRDNAIRTPGEMSVSQAARFNSEVRDVMDQALADAEDQRTRDLELRDSDVKVYDNVFSQLRAAGRTRDVADNEARVWSSFWRTMADRYGGDPLDLAQSMGVQIVGPQTPDAARRRNDLDIKLNTLRSNPQRALRAEGTDLLDFVRSKGGISDTGGDLAAMDAPKGIISETREQAEARRGQPNMLGLSDSKGTGLDEIGRAAIEAGYFPELMGGSDVQADGTVVDEAAVLLEALQRAISGEAIYPVGEGANQDMVDLSNELSRRGIDLAMSNDEIAAALEDQGGQAFDQSGKLITDTPEFRAWFGDSKVVDENGDPLVVYHGTNSDFDAFDSAMNGSATRATSSMSGFFFTSGERTARAYADYAAMDAPVGRLLDEAQKAGDRGDWDTHDSLIEQAEKLESETTRDAGQVIVPAYLSITNPMEVDAKGETPDGIGGIDPLIKKAKAAGHDGLIIRNFDDAAGLSDEVSDHFVAFSPTQIKSVYNRGTFDRSDPRILYQDEIDLEALISFADEQIAIEPVSNGDVTGSLTEYPVAIPPEYEFSNFRDIGGKIGSMTPDQFLSLSSDLAIDEETNDNVNDLAQMMLDGRKIDPPRLSVSEDGVVDSHDGRHRALAAKRLGISQVPVLLMGEKGAAYPDGLTQIKAQSGAGDMGAVVDLKPLDGGRTLFQSAAQENPLVVVHNISERGLLIADELGGLAAPSLAVAGGNVGFDNFGDITLVASQDMANPKSRGVRTFASDVYSARQPRARYDLKKSGLDRIESALGPAAEKIGIDSIWQEISEDRMASGIENAMENSDAAKMAFLESIGKAPRVVKRTKPEFDPRLKPFAKADVRTLYDNPEFDALALEMAEERIAAVSNENLRGRVEERLTVVEDGKRLPSYDMINDLAKRIEKNRAPEGIDRYETGRAIRARMNQTKKRQGEFEAWIQSKFGDVLTNKHFETETGRRKPYEMAPLVREITRSLRDAEGYNYGSGSVRALVTPEFKSIDAIKDRRGKIISDEEMKALGDEANNELFALADKFAGYHASGQDFGWGDIFSEFLKDLARGNLREWQSSIFSEPVPDNLIAEARGFLGKLADMPTHYFEVKMQRAVGLDEFAAAVVPKSASAETVARLKDAGLRIVRYEKNNAQSRLEALQKAGSREFFQRYEESGKRGSIQLPSGGLQDGQTVINLFESANLSTFIHESGHFFLEAFTALATSDTAPQGMKDDLAAIHKFLKVDGTAPLTTAQHEMWARGFEAYAMEGKAPSLALADAFGRFKSWLTRIYKTALGLNVKITPEIREVMDRMLATDAEIAAAREMQQMSPLFTSEAAAGMTPAAWETYQKMARRSEEQASQALLEKTMAKVRREKEKWWKDERADVKKEVTTTVDSKPEYRLIEMLANQKWIGSDDPVPDFQLDRAELVETFGDGVLAELSRSRFGGKRAIYGADGISLYEAAEFFGFANPTEMVETLQNTGKKKDAIELETDRIMADRYGDPLNDGSIEEEAVAAIHSDQQAQTVAAEARHLAGQAGKPTRNMTAKVFRQRARMMISRMSVKDATRPNAFLEAERKSAKRAEEAFARTTKGRNAGEALAAAAKHKEQQMLNHYLYMESRDLTKMVASKREKMRNYSKASVREKIGGEITNPDGTTSPGYIQQIDALLEGYDFRVRSAGQIKRSEKLRAFVDRMVEEGRERDLDIDERLLDEANRKHYTKMSVDELQGLFDTIENIDHMGRHKQKLVDEKNKRDLQEVADTFSTAISDRFGTGKAAKQSKQVRNFFNLLFSVDTMMVDLDGTETGDVYDLFKAPLDRGQAQEQQMNVAMADAVQDIFSVYSSKELSQMQVQKLIPGGNGHTWSKMEIISLALNTGHQDGRNRILEDTVHPERRLTQDQLDALLDTLEKGDWDFVQSMLKQVNSYWPELEATHNRRTGTKLKKIDAVPIETKFGVYPGGYYPLAYDSQRSIGAAKDEASAWDKFNAAGRGSRIEVKSGMTIARKENSGGRTLDFDLNVALRHMRDTIRVITMSEVVDNAARIIKHKDVETAFMDAGQTNQFNTLKLFLDDLAVGPVYNTDPINSFARIVKNNFTMAKLGFNWKTVALQATGIGQSAVVVGKRNMARGYRDYLANPSAGIQMAMEKSVFMSERKTSFQKDIYDQINDIQLSSPLAKRGTKVKNVVGKAGFWAMIRAQFLTVDVPTWIAAHDAKLREGATDEAAVKYADRIVARSQGSGLYADRTALERGTISPNMRQSDFIRLWTTLSNYMVIKMNRSYLAAQKGRRGFAEAESIGQMTGTAINLASDMALLYMFEAIVMGITYSLLAGDDADEEDLTKFIMTNTATSVIGGVPIVSGVANAFQGYGAGGVLASVLEMPANVATQLRQGENDAALWRSISDAGGMLTGLPSTATYRAIEGVVRGVDEGELPLADMFFGSNPLTR